MGFGVFKSFAWLGDERTAMGASIFVIVWSMVGFYMVLFIAAIKGIPAEVYEAARVDGAGRFRTAISITVPMIRDTIRTAYIYLGILALDAFVYMQALNSERRPGQLDAGDLAGPAEHRLQEGQVRLRHLDGRDAGDHHAGLCRPGLPGVLPDRRDASQEAAPRHAADVARADARADGRCAEHRAVLAQAALAAAAPGTQAVLDRQDRRGDLAHGADRLGRSSSARRCSGC